MTTRQKRPPDRTKEEKTAVGYVRVSTETQANEGLSLENQTAKIRAWAEAHGFILLGIFTDAVSGRKTTNRPGLQQALELTYKHGSALVVYSLSRMARSTQDALDISCRIDKAGGDLVSLNEKIDTTSAAGRMVFRMLAVLAEFESDLISERTKDVMRHLKANNRRVCSEITYGYDLNPDGKTLTENPAEQKAIRLMQRLRRSGFSYRRIVAELQRQRIPTRHGGKWQAPVVWRILRRVA